MLVKFSIVKNLIEGGNRMENSTCWD